MFLLKLLLASFLIGCLGIVAVGGLLLALLHYGARGAAQYDCEPQEEQTK